MTGAETYIIEHGLTSYLMGGVGVLISALCVVASYVIKLSMSKINNNIVSCKNELLSEIKKIEIELKNVDEYTKETRVSAYHAHDRVNEHIDKHHTSG